MSSVWDVRVKLAFVAIASLAGGACCLKVSELTGGTGSVWPIVACLGLVGAAVVLATCLAGFVSTFEPEERVAEADGDELDRDGDDWWKHGPREADQEE